METTKQERATWTPDPTAFDEETGWVLALCRDVDVLVEALRRKHESGVCLDCEQQACAIVELLRNPQAASAQAEG